MTTVTIPKTSSAGLKCHTGPGCRLHSPTGIASARKALRQATQAVQNSTTLEQMNYAKGQMVAAEALYDMTEEGQQALATAIKDETDPVEKKILANRLKKAKSMAAEVEADFAADYAAEAQNGERIVFPETHTYEEPTFTQGEGFYDPRVGSKYTGYRSTSEIAKDVRKDLKEAEAKGYLPAGLKYSVTRESYSGGQSLTVEIQGLKDSAIYTSEKNRYGSTDDTPEAKKLKERVSNIVEAYNSTCSRGEVDYYNTLFSGRVTIEDERGRQWRMDESKRKKKMAAAAKVRKDITQQINTTDINTFLQNNNVTFDKKTVDDVPFARIGDSYMVAFQREDYRKNKYIEIYDFTSVTNAPNGAGLDDIFEKGQAYKILPKRKKNRFIYSHQ